MVLIRNIILLILFVCSLIYAEEKRVKIAILDTGIRVKGLEKYLCKHWEYDLTGYGIYDYFGHGTNVAWLIADKINPTKACLIIIKVTQSSHSDLYSTGLQQAIILNAHYINFSASGKKPDHWEWVLIDRALKNDIRISVASGNNGENLGKKCDVYPACYRFDNDRHFYVVGNFKNNKPYNKSNYGGPVNIFLDGNDKNGGGIILSGSSMSTAIWTGLLANEECK